MRTISSRFSRSVTVLGLMIAVFLLVTCTPAVAPTTKPGELWHVVVLGDSQSWGYGEYYAKQLEADLGAKIELDDLSLGNLRTGQLLGDLRGDPLSRPEVRSSVKQAKVVTFIAPPADQINLPIVSLAEEDKLAESGRTNCSSKALEDYKADLEAIIAEIFSLRKGQPTIVLAKDYYCPFYSDWKKVGRYDEYKRCWDALNATIHQVAAEHKIPVAEVYAAFNGPNHDQDPRDKGYLGADGIHTNEAGRQLMADQFRKLGYEFIVP
jgi:lysophospholipase L1-like esterase